VIFIINKGKSATTALKESSFFEFLVYGLKILKISKASNFAALIKAF
jgi:hypothetical protein